MNICFNSKGNPIRTYDEWQRAFWKGREADEEEATVPDGSLTGEGELRSWMARRSTRA